VARPARLTGGLPVDEVFTTTTGAPRGCVPATRSSYGGNGSGGDVLEHREVNWGEASSKEKDEGDTAELTEGGEKRRWRL
jgi:hypothetical protein